MNTHADKAQENESRSVSNTATLIQSGSKPAVQFVDNRPEALLQLELKEMANNSPQMKQMKACQEMADKGTQARQAAQLRVMAGNSKSGIGQRTIKKKENDTGLSNKLKSGIENLSGYSMDDVKVHFNSDKPARLQAHAYAQGVDIYLGPGQEKHLPHEAWHVVQQKQGRVKPTKQLNGKVAVNDDEGLEKEADVKGAKALYISAKLEREPHTEAIRSNHSIPSVKQLTHAVIQRNAVRDAFLTGAKVVVAGERHGRINKQEERSAWGTYGVNVNYEYEALAVTENGMSGTVKLDDPFLRLLSVVDWIGEILEDSVDEWALDPNKENQKMLIDMLRNECSGARGENENYLESPGDQVQQKQVQLLVEYVNQIEKDMVSYYQLPPLFRQTKGGDLLRQVKVNIELLRAEVRKAYLTQRESNVTDNLVTARSKRMFTNVRQWAAKSKSLTIWKVGDRHITDMEDMLRNGATLPDAVALVHQAPYEMAFLALIRPMRAKTSEEFMDTLQ